MPQRPHRPAPPPAAPFAPTLRGTTAACRRQAAQATDAAGRAWPGRPTVRTVLLAPWHAVLMLCLASSVGLGSLAQAEPAPAAAAAATAPTTAPAHPTEPGAHTAPAPLAVPATPSGLTQPGTAGHSLTTAEPPPPGPAVAEARLTAPITTAPAAAVPPAEPPKPSPLSDKGLQVKSMAQGVVSFYANFFSGRSTANGERFDQRAMTMAHRSLPFGTLVRVVCLRTERSVVVRVNDRGPFVGGRVGDLSRAAAEQLNMVQAGLTQARLEVLGPPTPVKALPRTRPAAERPNDATPRR